MGFTESVAQLRDFVLDPLLGPLLSLPSFWGLLILSFLVSLIITIVYKYTTNQSLMKDLKDEIKAFQKQIKELRNHPEEAMKVQREAMKTNMKYMKQSFKATFYTIIPIIFIFGWMTGHYSFEPIAPGEDFTTTVHFKQPVIGEVELVPPPGVKVDGSQKKEVNGDNVLWIVQGGEGNHILKFLYKGDPYTKEVLITTEQLYTDPIEKVDLRDSDVSHISIDYEKKKILNLFGWKVGWLGSYIIFSIIFSIVLRKGLKVY